MPGAIDFDQPFMLGTESHTLRVQIAPSGEASVVMASNGFRDFRDQLTQLRGDLRPARLRRPPRSQRCFATRSRP